MSAGENTLFVRDFISSLVGKREDSLFQDWLLWPPDVFLVTSILLQRTGCYRIALVELEEEWLNAVQDTHAETASFKKGSQGEMSSSKKFYWQSEKWQEDIRSVGSAWINVTGFAAMQEHSGSLAEIKEKIVTKRSVSCKGWIAKLELLERLWHKLDTEDVNIEELRLISSDTWDSLDLQLNADFSEEKFYKCREIALILVWIHALADEACMGFGLVSECYTTSLDKYEFATGIRAFAKMKANLLLISTGSLSTVSKFHGVVLPKMRTPQVGFILRSMSHHISYHATEVEVIWRTIPWLNSNEKTLNVLAFPFPYQVSNDDFKVMEERYHSVRYFQPNFEKKNVEGIAMLEAIIKLVFDLHDTGTTIHMIVFPECALKEEEYQHMLSRFHKLLAVKSTGESFKLPMIIAGVIGLNGSDQAPLKQMDKAERYVNNEVRVASYFAGRWYEVKQRKHHRWQLDRKQIIQYDLQGVLSTERRWFEYTTVSQRRLTFLAPNDWLVITSLICEDLARLEPVSEIIRGVGPTFLVALLSDGPQLTERWSARYASVLADDPGTAVFSLTSYGMASRSKPENADTDARIPGSGTVVGLWRDAVTGFKIMKSTQANTAQLITISAEFQKEQTLDGREDGGKAPSFKIDRVKEISIGETKAEKKTFELNETEWGNWEDIRQLSVFVFTLDAAIDLLLMTVSDASRSKGSQNTEIKEFQEENTIPEDIKSKFDLYWNEILSILMMKHVPGNSVRKKNYEPFIEKVKYEKTEQSEISKHAFDHMLHKTKQSLQQPLKYGVGVRTYYAAEWPTKEVQFAYSNATRIFKESTKALDSSKLPETVTSIMRVLFEKAKFVFEDEQTEMGRLRTVFTKEQIRTRQAVPIAMVMAIDNKLSNWKLTHKDDLTELKRLRTEIRAFLNSCYKRVRVAK
ncbi:hypothetical protein LZZ85_08515 [Terrimonas sp. NA20]|uniref:Uncharacterized protein n=1 Tax=Terrimonas ginsenosidimutans TaxID=2908004 RepID=A0ABS9KPT0_9BACT|nr:hypothetical protein [Terrimonas ginsenosidimutans]MCG2614323.1 hypothetical protein [Terrimonas ginsenosidimutans]